MRRFGLISATLTVLLATAAHAATVVENVRLWTENGQTRVVFDLSGPVQHSIFTLRGPDRLVLDIKDTRMADRLRTMPGGAGAVKAIRSALRADGQLRVVLDLNGAVRSRSFAAGPNDQYGDRLVIDLQSSSSVHAVKRAADEYQSGRDIVIAIDPGHGGHDPGAIGRAHTREKDVALAISKDLAARVNAEPGMHAVLTRNTDIYIDLRERMQIARDHKADLFVSVHADAVRDRRAGGASVYALSLKGASDEAARQLAERENASVRIGDVGLADKDPVLASVLIDLSQNAALGASLDVGSQVIRELSVLGDVHRRTVQQAGFLVLKSPDMPSILVETAYISNPSEESRLRNPAHQAEIAAAVLTGIRRYFYANPPPDTQIAQQRSRDVRRVASLPTQHVITRGDTLSDIAARYDVSLAEIRSFNRLQSDSIRVGQKLRIPIHTGT